MQEQAEIEKILQGLSAQAAGCTRDLEEDQKILTRLDFIFAKAKFAKDYLVTEPIFNTDGIIDLKQARHRCWTPKRSFRYTFISEKTLPCCFSPTEYRR